MDVDLDAALSGGQDQPGPMRRRDAALAPFNGRVEMNPQDRGNCGRPAERKNQRAVLHAGSVP